MCQNKSQVDPRKKAKLKLNRACLELSKQELTLLTLSK